MARRTLLLAPLAAVLIGGCTYGAPTNVTHQQESARVAFIKSHAKYSDRDLAQLCPALYPPDFLTNSKKYPESKQSKGHKTPTVTQADREQAQAAGCGTPKI